MSEVEAAKAAAETAGAWKTAIAWVAETKAKAAAAWAVVGEAVSTAEAADAEAAEARAVEARAWAEAAKAAEEAKNE